MALDGIGRAVAFGNTSSLYGLFGADSFTLSLKLATDLQNLEQLRQAGSPADTRQLASSYAQGLFDAFAEDPEARATISTFLEPYLFGDPNSVATQVAQEWTLRNGFSQTVDADASLTSFGSGILA